MATKTIEVEVLTALAPFDLAGKHYEPGDEFIVPAGWTRDTSYEQLVNKDGRPGRVCFTIPGVEATKTDPGRDERRMILPLNMDEAAPVVEEAKTPAEKTEPNSSKPKGQSSKPKE